MLIWIDQRREGYRCLDGRIQPQPKFIQEGQVGTESGRDNQLVDQNVAAAARRTGGDAQLIAGSQHMRNGEPGLDAHPAGGDQRREGGTEFSARGKLIVGTAAERLRRIVAAQQPDDLGARRFRLQMRKLGERTDRGMAGAEHCHGLAGVAVARDAADIRHRVCDPAREFSDRRQSVRAGRIRRRPRAGSIDDGVGAERLWTLAILVTDLERRVLTPLGFGFVEADAADRRHPA